MPNVPDESWLRDLDMPMATERLGPERERGKSGELIVDGLDDGRFAERVESLLRRLEDKRSDGTGEESATSEAVLCG